MQLWIQSIGFTHCKHRIECPCLRQGTRRGHRSHGTEQDVLVHMKAIKDMVGGARRQWARLVPFESGTRNMASPGSRNFRGCALAAPCARLPPRSALTTGLLNLLVSGVALFHNPLGNFAFLDAKHALHCNSSWILSLAALLTPEAAVSIWTDSGLTFPFACAESACIIVAPA